MTDITWLLCTVKFYIGRKGNASILDDDLHSYGVCFQSTFPTSFVHEN